MTSRWLRYSLLAYWLPRSEWCISPDLGFLRQKALSERYLTQRLIALNETPKCSAVRYRVYLFLSTHFSVSCSNSSVYLGFGCLCSILIFTSNDLINQPLNVCPALLNHYSCGLGSWCSYANIIMCQSTTNSFLEKKTSTRSPASFG